MATRVDEMAVTSTSKVPFSKQYKGKRLCDCPDKFLQWCAEKLKDTDLCEYAVAAQAVLGERAGDNQHQDLEAAADALLRRAGFKVGKNGEIL